MTYDEAYRTVAERWRHSLDGTHPQDLVTAIEICMPRPLPYAKYFAWVYPWLVQVLSAACTATGATQAEVQSCILPFSWTKVAKDRDHALEWLLLTGGTSFRTTTRGAWPATEGVLGKMWMDAMRKDRDRFLSMLLIQLDKAARELVTSERVGDVS